MRAEPASIVRTRRAWGAFAIAFACSSAIASCGGGGGPSAPARDAGQVGAVVQQSMAVSDVAGRWHYLAPGVKAYSGAVSFVVRGRVFSGTLSRLIVDRRGRMTLDAYDAPGAGLVMKPGDGVSHVDVVGR